MKVGILTYFRACNYGAYLQACSLCNRLNQEKDIEAEVIDFRMEKERFNYSKKSWTASRIVKNPMKYAYFNNLIETFEKEHQHPLAPVSTPDMCSDSIGELQDLIEDRYDMVIVGSDEVWKTNGFRGFPNPYWLPFETHVKKTAYAVSSRSDFSALAEEKHNALNKYVNDFELIGVRDQITYDEVKKELVQSEKLILTCDPSFLYGFKKELSEANNPLKRAKRVDPDKKTVLVLTEDEATAKRVKNQLAGQYNLISAFEHHQGYINLKNVTPIEWLKLISSVDLVISSLFHGVCFSIVCGTSYIAVPTRTKREKILDLIKDGKNVVESETINLGFENMVKKTIEEPVDYSGFIKEQTATFNRFLAALRQTIC